MNWNNFNASRGRNIVPVNSFTTRFANIDTFNKKGYAELLFLNGKNPVCQAICLMMRWIGNIGLMALFLAVSSPLAAQRNYAANSVLGSGNWYKLSVKTAGVYKIDISFLNSLGVNTSGLSSQSLRLFGNGGNMPGEANNSVYQDDLIENSIQVIDGGDGMLNGGDYILFYSDGPHKWIKDSANHRFSHAKNIYSDKAFYFLNIGGNGSRIATPTAVNSPNIAVNSYLFRFFHELDSVNFLSSGKEWYGEEFADAPGKSLSRVFSVSVPNLLPGSSLELTADLVARSVGGASRFDISINDQPAGQLLINPVSGGIYDLFAQTASGIMQTATAQNPVKIKLNFIPGSFGSQGWLNRFQLFGRAQLSLSGMDQLLFRDWQSVGNNRAEFIVSQATANTQVWDVTDPLHPLRMPGTFSAGEFRFVNDCSRLREYIAFQNTGFLQPMAEGKLGNQDLHNSQPADLLLISHPSLLSEAQRLAQFHQQRDGYRVKLVTTEQVYNEFSNGSPDPVALRNWVKMYYDRYGSVPVNKPRWLLLFGDASFDFKDRINNNTSLVPAYENNFSLDPLSTYTSDDFFGFLDDNEDINAGLIINYLDIGIGRVPAKNAEEAKNFVDKVIAYYDPGSLGPWRNNLSFVADDEDQNLHVQDAEILTATASVTEPILHVDKTYLDAFQQESGAGGSIYPKVNQSISNKIYTGTLIWNFNGHGGARRLAQETILDQEMVNHFDNPYRLPLFITATCDFAPYDNPVLESLGENILLRPKTGAIALMTTTRVVFAFSNRIMNDNYLRYALQADANGFYRTLGDAVKDAKNFTYQTSGDISNNRKFALLGDPAMTIAFPNFRVRATKVNGIPVAQTDTLSAAEKVTIEGDVTDVQGNLLTGFTGNVYPTIYDKPQQVTTLANDPSSQVTTFSAQSNILFRGKATVNQGHFSFSFKVPKDINYYFGNGRLGLYAENGSVDANGIFTGFIIGGAAGNADPDRTGPLLKAFLNDERFVNGGISGPQPLLIIKLSDTSGINTAGTGIGHDLVATLDDDNNQYFILNDFYEGDLDNYQQGSIRFRLPELAAGAHSLKIKAWDVLNNSSEIILEFTVVNDSQLELAHVLNYPNPFTTKTQFWFEHNRPGLPLDVSIQVMTISGRVIKTIRQTVISDGNRSAEIEWDGKDEYGDRPGRGVYIYKLRVSSPDKKKKEVIGKLVIL
jgi:hypothetical protein